MRRQPERGAMHDRDPLGLQQVFDEILVGPDQLAVRRLLAQRPGAGRIDIERTVGPVAVQPGNAVQPIDDEVAPLPNSAWCFGMKSCGPVSASIAAAWLIEHGFAVEFDWIAPIALIRCVGPPP